jgi:hypothetical protein
MPKLYITHFNGQAVGGWGGSCLLLRIWYLRPEASSWSRRLINDCCYSLALSAVARRIWLSGCPEFEPGKALIALDKVDLSCVSVLAGKMGYDLGRRPSFQC